MKASVSVYILLHKAEAINFFVSNIQDLRSLGSWIISLQIEYSRLSSLLAREVSP